MLRRLTIEDFGLIARAEIALGPGLTCLTGETGSGKSMVLGALSFVLGVRAASDVVRRDAARARVALELDGDAIRTLLAEFGMEDDDGESVVISREIAAGGKSSARINGRPVAVGQLRAIGERVVEYVGQHEQQRLTEPAYQLELLDRYAGPPAAGERARVRAAYERAAQARRERRALEESEATALQQRDYAEFALGDIREARPGRGEDDALRARREYLGNVERIAEALRGAHRALTEGEGAAIDALGIAATDLGAIARFDDRLAALSDRARGLQAEAGELAIELADALEGTEFDPGELDAVTARLSLLDRLKKKYGGTLDGVLEAEAGFARTIASMESRGERLTALAGLSEEAAAELRAGCERLRRLRERAARALERGIAQELGDLAMGSARVAVAFHEQEPGPDGSERVELLLSSNKGEPLRPLAKTASGGELSRVLLALAVVTSERGRVFVFDEIDAGIGGETARQVAIRLARLAAGGQVLCVTHLAQIAVYAAAHYVLGKRETRSSTTIEAEALEAGQAVVAEISRMLAGSAESDAGARHAEELLKEAARTLETHPSANR
ncbi:MAG TPA: DNA repair protein RecN [Candidatus Dormibacteraeota bacterium]|nr:DNA repair protein RecN [Candidatus Dormibacteraeota bacterium]